MAKKGLLVLVLAAVVAGGAFAQLSAGGGIVYSGDFTSGMSVSIPGAGSAELKMPSNAFGFYGFFDAKYVEASVGLLFGTTTVSVSGGGMSMDLYDLNTTTMSLGLLGKFPIPIGKIVLFPALGIEYNYVLSAEDKDAGSMDDPADLSDLWFRFGVGLDFDITEQLFLRGTVLFGIDLGSQFENDLEDLIYSYTGVHPEHNIGFGPKIQFAVGYKF